MQRDARLADAAGADERHQRMIVYELLYLGQHVVATDERRKLTRQVVRHRFELTQGWERLG
ncbi:MAG TPA: hypothetical protein VGF86_00850 [Candidatus Tumulicola sp.]